jgi:hypothetical protein
MENTQPTSDDQTKTTEQTTTAAPQLLSSPVKANAKVTKNNPLLWVLAGFGVLVILGLAAWGFQQSSGLKKANSQVSGLDAEKKKLSEEVEKRKNTTGEANIDKSLFQAVFLKDGQVYFGKITKITESQITIENIYYLRQGKSGAKLDLANLPDDTSLVKLGCEIHGPKDEMFIERKEVEFWENLKKDGQVAKAIDEYQKANPNGQKCEPGA